MNIEETLYYLAVRSLLVNQSSEDLINQIDSEEAYKLYVDNISRIMQEENFIFVSDALVQKVSDLVYHYRFDYIKNKQINDNVNYIIERFHDYKMMSSNRKVTLAKEWMKEEGKNRGLPAKYVNAEDLFSLISLDGYYFQGMINIGEEFAVENIMEYVSLLNLLLNRFSTFFDDNLFLEITKQNCEALKSIPGLPKKYLKMINKILDRINKEYADSSDVNVQVKYYFKKKDN